MVHITRIIRHYTEVFSQEWRGGSEIKHKWWFTEKIQKCHEHDTTPSIAVMYPRNYN